MNAPNNQPPYIEKDKRGRIVAASYPDGWAFEREFDDGYKCGEIPYYVIETMHGKKIYEREGDQVLFGK